MTTKPGDAPTLTEEQVDAMVTRAWRVAHAKEQPLPGWTGVALRAAITEAYRAGAASRCPPSVSMTDKTYYHCPACNHPQPFIEILRAVAKVSPIDAAQQEKPL